MYSPVKPSDKSRQQIKEQKKQQLAVLLVNKFRNKFNVVTTQETEIDKVILNEVTKLL